MVEWLAANWLPLIIVIIAMVIGIAIILKKKGLRQAAIDAIVYAQKEMKTEEGKVKMQAAIDYIQQLVPFLAWVPDSIIESFIQSVFNQIEDALKLPTEEVVAVIEDNKAAIDESTKVE